MTKTCRILTWRAMQNAGRPKREIPYEMQIVGLASVMNYNPRCAGVAELVDAPDLGSGAARRGGSSPFARTMLGWAPFMPFGRRRDSLRRTAQRRQLLDRSLEGTDRTPPQRALRSRGSRHHVDLGANAVILETKLYTPRIEKFSPPMPVDHYENFPVASWLLPRDLREPVSAIYAFARSADDFADEGNLSATERLRLLGTYRSELEGIIAGQPTQQPVFLRLRQAIAKHNLPLQPFFDLLDAFGQDVTKTRYAEFSELMAYCARSANPVGRLLLRLYQAESPQQIAWSDSICSGLQLINHWQDICADLKKGRIYLPQEDLTQFDVNEAQIAAGDIDDRWRDLMRFQIARARTMMLEGDRLGRTLPGRIGMELRLIVAGGLRILEKIEAVDYDVFRRRPQLRFFDWPLLAWRAV